MWIIVSSASLLPILSRQVRSFTVAEVNMGVENNVFISSISVNNYAQYNLEILLVIIFDDAFG